MVVGISATATPLATSLGLRNAQDGDGATACAPLAYTTRLHRSDARPRVRTRHPCTPRSPDTCHVSHGPHGCAAQRRERCCVAARTLRRSPFARATAPLRRLSFPLPGGWACAAAAPWTAPRQRGSVQLCSRTNNQTCPRYSTVDVAATRAHRANVSSCQPRPASTTPSTSCRLQGACARAVLLTLQVQVRLRPLHRDANGAGGPGGNKVTRRVPAVHVPERTASTSSERRSESPPHRAHYVTRLAPTTEQQRAPSQHPTSTSQSVRGTCPTHTAPPANVQARRAACQPPPVPLLTP